MRRRSASGTPGRGRRRRCAACLALARRVQADRVVGIGAAGVLEQVHEHLPDHRLVDVDRWELGRTVDVDVAGPRALQPLVDRARRAARRPASACAAGASAPASMRERSSMLSTSRTSRRASCSMPLSRRVALVLGHVLAQGRGRGRDRGQRRAQVMRDGLQERVAQAIGLLQRLQHHPLVLEARAPEREPEDARRTTPARRPSRARRAGGRCRPPGSRT